MKAAVFVAPGKIVVEERPLPEIGVEDALIRVTTTTICGTDVHIHKGAYPVAPGRIVGHEPVGVIAGLGAAVTGHHVGQRVIAGAITPCGQCHACLDGARRGAAAGCGRGYRLQPHLPGRRDPGAHRRARRGRRDRGARHPADLRERAARAPAGRRAVEPRRLLRQAHPAARRLSAGLGDHRIVTTLCPGGKERMRRLMNIVAAARVDLTPLVTHRFTLDQIEEAYDLFAQQRDGVLKVALVP